MQRLIGTVMNRPHAARLPSAPAALLLFGLALLTPSHAAAADNEEIAELRQMLRDLQAQNRELSLRLSTLESTRDAARVRPARTQEPAAIPATAAMQILPAAATQAADPPPLPEPRDTSNMSIGRRVTELEIGWAAQENATRQIIRDALSKTGPKINSFLALSGVVEFTASRSRDFGERSRDKLELTTTELDFDIIMSPWLTGSLVLHFESATSPVFPTSTTISSPVPGGGVERFSLDRTHILIGDYTRFPIAARVGREVLHFGTTTGVARLDTLSIGTPLTTEVFENRQTAAGVEFAFPTAPLKPPPVPVIVPPVKPWIVAPAVSQSMRWLGYTPLPERVLPPAPVTLPVDPPPFYGSFMVYKGNEIVDPNRRYIQDFNASLGYRTSGHCGRPYEELRSSWVCPWTFDIHVDYNTSVFDSRFLAAGYLPFLNQIRSVPGIAASVKASFGPFAVVGEVNSVIDSVTFVDGVGILRNIKPMTWQGSIAYQFDWNPWVTEIGHQGNFISVAYSGSKDLAGATALISGVPTRVGFVPQNRLLVTAGEWPMSGVRLAVEYSANWDYPVSAGGTAQLAHGVFGQFQLNF